MFYECCSLFNQSNNPDWLVTFDTEAIDTSRNDKNY